MSHPFNFKDLTGKVFTYLTVLKFDKIRNKRTYWLAKCKCGKIVSIQSYCLISGSTKSCGCFGRTINIKHGLCMSRFHRIWHNIKQRCLNPNNTAFKDYGGRDIKVCGRWLDFNNFKEDMYESYLKHVEEFGEKNTSINRKDVDGNYEPSNCEWVTRSEQQRNTRISANSKDYDKHSGSRRRLKSCLYHALRQQISNAKCVELFGIDLFGLKQHIESQFLPGMNWSNQGNGLNKWNLDHIIGCNNFDLSIEEDCKKCFYYTNLQPLWWKDHRKKSTVRLTASI